MSYVHLRVDVDILYRHGDWIVLEASDLERSVILTYQK